MVRRWLVVFAFPCFLSAQIANPGAAPLTVGEKFEFRAKRTFELSEFLSVGVGAALDQWRDDPDEWGQGAKGYGRRYASRFGSNIVRQSLAFGLDSTLHEDPRYFRSAEHGAKRRIHSALLQVLVCHTDSGGQTFAVSRVGSAFGAGLISNYWRPGSVNDVGDGLIRGAETLALDAASNLLQEFRPEIRRLFKRH